MKIRPIQWKTWRYGTVTGHIDGMHLFTIHHMPGLNPKYPYVLEFTINGYTEGACTSIESAKEKAVERLIDFISRLTEVENDNK